MMLEPLLDDKIKIYITRTLGTLSVLGGKVISQILRERMAFFYILIGSTNIYLMLMTIELMLLNGEVG